MSLRLIRMSDLQETPWKNGGGITREIADHHGEDGLIWRLSMADVASDGAFSSFEGLTRVLTVILGDGMTLTSADCVLHADFALPVIFDGATPITSQLKNGPLRDLNLMFDATRCEGSVTPLCGPLVTDYPADADMTYGVHCVTGTAMIGGDVSLAPGDTALITSSPLELSLQAETIALVIALRLRA